MNISIKGQDLTNVFISISKDSNRLYEGTHNNVVMYKLSWMVGSFRTSLIERKMKYPQESKWTLYLHASLTVMSDETQHKLQTMSIQG